MATLQSAIRVTTEGKAEVKRDWQEIGQAGASAHEQISRSSDQAGAALDRQMAKWKQMAAAAKEAEQIQERQAQFNALAGIGGSGKSAADSAAVFEALMPANGNAKLNNQQMMELTHSARAFFDVIAAGGSPTRALAMESGRLAQVLGSGQGGVAGTLKMLGAAALEWAGPVGVLAVIAGGIALWVGEMHAAKVQAEELAKANTALTSVQHAGMSAIDGAISFAQKYHVTTDALFTSLEHVITSQGAMNDIVKRGIGVTDDAARAARDRAEAERLLTVEKLRQAAVEATTRAGEARKTLGGFERSATIRGMFVGAGLEGNPEALTAAQAAHDEALKKSGADRVRQDIQQENDLAKALNDQAEALAKSQLVVEVRNTEAEGAARKAEEAARKAAAEAKKQQQEELLLEQIRVNNLVELARLRGDKTALQNLELEARAQQKVNQYIHAGLTELQARRRAEIDLGNEQLAQSQGRVQALLEEAKGMKTLAQLTADWARIIPANENQEALDSFNKSEIRAFETLGDKLTDTQGKMKSWGETFKDVIAQVISDFEKLAILNPLENALFGGVQGYQAKPAISGIGSFFAQILTGGRGNADGTDNWDGGWTWVGERGPEIVNLPRGSQVFSNAQSSQMGGTTIHINMDARGADASAARSVQLQLDRLRAELPALIVHQVNDGRSRRRIG